MQDFQKENKFLKNVIFALIENHYGNNEEDFKKQCAVLQKYFDTTGNLQLGEHIMALQSPEINFSPQGE